MTDYTCLTKPPFTDLELHVAHNVAAIGANMSLHHLADDLDYARIHGIDTTETIEEITETLSYSTVGPDDHYVDQLESYEAD